MYIQLGYHPLWVVRYKAGSGKPPLDIVFCDGSKKRLPERIEKFQLADVCDVHPHQLLNLAAIRLLQRRKTTNI